jgi:hypothetical protein
MATARSVPRRRRLPSVRAHSAHNLIACDPTHAYREAVRAVEAAVIPVVSSKNKIATLGAVIRGMKDAPQKSTVVFQPAHGDPVAR